MPSAADAALGWRDFRAVNRGGGLYSAAVSQPFGAVLAAGSARVRVPPNMLSLANLVVGVLGSLAVIVHIGPSWLALVAWQLAYAFDCADGQLARATGRASAAGARLDVLCDLAVQIGVVSAIAAVSTGPRWLLAAFAGTWMVNLVTSVLQSGPAPLTLVRSRAAWVRVAKLGRDYGAVVLLAGLVLAVLPQWTVVLVALLTAVNGLFLLASIVAAYRA